MIIEPLAIEGVFLIEDEPIIDERGSFSRVYCKDELAKAGFTEEFVQHNISHNKNAGTIRGFHFQSSPFEESKIVRCISGSIFDVIVDVRKTSSTYGQSISLILEANDRKAVLISKGLAHGFQTLENNSSIYYLMSEFYHPKSGKGICWNDPKLNIQWPLESTIVSDKDSALPTLDEFEKNSF